MNVIGKLGFDRAKSEPSKILFLAHNYVAVAPAFANCTEVCIRRKGLAKAQPTNIHQPRKLETEENKGAGVRSHKPQPRNRAESPDWHSRALHAVLRGVRTRKGKN